jgi:hypothetical protein
MPTSTSYTYALSAFPAGINEDRFVKEIRESSVVTALDGVSTSGSTVSVVFKDELSGNDQLTLDGIVAQHSGQPLPNPTSADGVPLVAFPQRQPDGVVRVALSGRQGKEVNYGSIDFADKTSWYAESVRVTNKTVVDMGNGTWSLGDVDIIDILGGHIFDEDAAVKDQQESNPGDPHGYLVVLTVDGVQKEPRRTYKTSGGDFVLDYHTGIITPDAGEDWSGKSVVASYSKAATSGFSLVPTDPGRTLIVGKVRVKVSDDIELRDTIKVQFLGPAGVFAPHAVAAGMLPDDYMVEIADSTLYKTIDQLMDEVDDVTDFAAGGFAGPRGFTRGRRVFTFRYETVRTLYSSLGMRMRISLEHDVACGGQRATAVFYCVSGVDPGAAKAMENLLAGG